MLFLVLFTCLVVEGGRKRENQEERERESTVVKRAFKRRGGAQLSCCVARAQTKIKTRIRQTLSAREHMASNTLDWARELMTCARMAIMLYGDRTELGCCHCCPLLVELFFLLLCLEVFLC